MQEVVASVRVVVPAGEKKKDTLGLAGEWNTQDAVIDGLC